VRVDHAPSGHGPLFPNASRPSSNRRHKRPLSDRRTNLEGSIPEVRVMSGSDGCAGGGRCLFERSTRPCERPRRTVTSWCFSPRRRAIWTWMARSVAKDARETCGGSPPSLHWIWTTASGLSTWHVDSEIRQEHRHGVRSSWWVTQSSIRRTRVKPERSATSCDPMLSVWCSRTTYLIPK
jgi:hypothetical protein